MNNLLTLCTRTMRRALLLVFGALLASVVDAQRRKSTYSPTDAPTRYGSIEMKTLYLDVDALAFFKDNEFDGNIAKGYTLPGVRLTPHLSYRPRPEFEFRIGTLGTDVPWNESLSQLRLSRHCDVEGRGISRRRAPTALLSRNSSNGCRHLCVGRPLRRGPSWFDSSVV